MLTGGSLTGSADLSAVSLMMNSSLNGEDDFFLSLLLSKPSKTSSVYTSPSFLCLLTGLYYSFSGASAVLTKSMYAPLLLSEIEKVHHSSHVVTTPVLFFPRRIQMKFASESC